MKYNNIDSLIAEVKSNLNKYDDANLLDDDSMYRDILLGLKGFGNDIMDIHETVVEVEDSQVDLPENFRTLYFAYLCEPLGYKLSTDPEVEFHELQSSHFYVERTQYNRKWKTCDNCCEDTSTNVIRENFYFKHKKAAEFYYQNPQLLSLGKSFNKNACTKDCRNKMVKDNPNQIVIRNNTLYANFPEGDIYMQYYGLPTDDDGHINIPETKNGWLELYLEYFVKRRAAELLIGNNDAQGLQNLYSVYQQQEQLYLKKASNELKMGNINPEQYRRRMKRLNRMESLQFESAFSRMYT